MSTKKTFKVARSWKVFEISLEIIIFAVCLYVAYHGSLHDIFYILLLIYKSQKTSIINFWKPPCLVQSVPKLKKWGKLTRKYSDLDGFYWVCQQNLENHEKSGKFPRQNGHLEKFFSVCRLGAHTFRDMVNEIGLLTDFLGY